MDDVVNVLDVHHGQIRKVRAPSELVISEFFFWKRDTIRKKTGFAYLLGTPVSGPFGLVLRFL
jgi:hypothetical protein